MNAIFDGSLCQVTGDCADGCFTVTFAGSVPDCEVDVKPGTTCVSQGAKHFTQKITCPPKAGAESTSAAPWAAFVAVAAALAAVCSL